MFYFIDISLNQITLSGVTVQVVKSQNSTTFYSLILFEYTKNNVL
ncbi:hypothetical protein GEOBRER4_n2915 [Citrifermentans bremense]|uniref:Uncharacterized protein n=1 Tax=Citrifermentans bremense TaxID=60035 RepID=A0A7R7J0B4_9BACT|nr:hypothetical protein GEOBRER4_n2915 [Citrifermentans bremense]